MEDPVGTIENSGATKEDPGGNMEDPIQAQWRTHKNINLYMCQPKRAKYESICIKP